MGSLERMGSCWCHVVRIVRDPGVTRWISLWDMDNMFLHILWPSLPCSPQGLSWLSLMSTGSDLIIRFRDEQDVEIVSNGHVFPKLFSLEPWVPECTPGLFRE